MLVAIDCEFVSVGKEEAEITADGRRVIRRARQLRLARVSLLDCRNPMGECFLDDYCIPSEPVVDYLTRFSGLKPEDLDPAASRHHLVTLKQTYLKLRWLADNGAVFVGHGLDNDFHTCNLYIPREQIIDTVHLFHLPGRRMFSLRFLSAYLLRANIQSAGSEGHDSIEDARAALLLYRKYAEVRHGVPAVMDMMQLGLDTGPAGALSPGGALGAAAAPPPEAGERHFMKAMQALYDEGRKCSWRADNVESIVGFRNSMVRCLADVAFVCCGRTD